MSDRTSRPSRPSMRPVTPEQQFWQQWREGTRPDLAAFLAARPSLPSGDAAAVISIDQYERWLGGERVRAEEYGRLLPGDSGRDQALCDIVYGEYLLREQLGERPAIDEYQRRFPAVAVLLGRQIDLHRALADEGDDLPSIASGATPSEPVPPQIPGYTTLEVIGRGGMGVVYKARQVSLDRDVALKVLPVPAGLDPLALERMHREAQITAKLSHPNIVTVFDAGVVPGWFYLAMEYVAGVDLHHLVEQRGPLPVAWACDYVRQAALGLLHAQEVGLVHRDIKPSNLIVSPVPGPSDSAPPGTVKILDLGLASFAEEKVPERSPVTQVGSFMGTPDFIAPEQASDPRKADIRSDLYSLGCTFFYLLTGQVPFSGATPMAKVMQHHVQDATPVEHLREEVPTVVGAIVRRLLAKRPEDRYQTPADLIRALTMAVSPPVIAPLAPPRAATQPRSRLIRSFIGHDDWVKSVAFSDEGGWLASGSLDGSVRLWQPDTGQEVWRAGPHAGGVSCVAFSDDGRWLASVGQDRFLALHEVASRKPVWKVACHERNVDRLVFVLAGAALLSGGHDGFLRLWDVSTGRPIRAWQAHAGAVWGLAPLSKGERVLSGGQDRTLRLWDLSTGQAIASFPEQPMPVTCVELSPDKRIALIGSLDGRIQLWDMPQQCLRCTLTGHTGRVTDLALSPDGRKAVSASRDQTLRLWDLAGGTPGEVLTGHTAWVTSVAWSPCGKVIASGSVDRRVCLWNVEDAGEVRGTNSRSRSSLGSALDSPRST